jgi:hypothetical protein
MIFLSFFIIVILIYIFLGIIKNNNKTIEIQKDIQGKKEENEKRREMLDILDKIKKVDFEPLEEELLSHDINEKFLDKILEKYVKLTQITVNDIALYEDICSVEIEIKKPDMEILKFDLLYVWRDMEEKISENCIDGKLLNEMADIFSDIIKNEKIYYIEEKMTIYFDKKNYLWEMSEYNHDELIHSLTSFENFMEIIDEIRIEKS